MPVSNELLLISAMLRTKDHVLPASRGIGAEMFHGYREQYEWIEKYVAEHGRTPSTGAFHIAFSEIMLKKVDDLEYFIGKVRDDHSRRVLISGLHDVQNQLKIGNVDAAIKMLSSASVRAESSRLGHGTDGDIIREYTDVKEEVLRRKKRAEQTGFAGIPTGFPTLDELTSGIQPGWFVVLAARSGIGKTRSLIRMACAATFSGFTTQYDALEQSRPEIAMQVHAFMSSEYGQEVFKSLDLAQGKGFSTGAYLKFLQNMSQTVQGRMHVADSTRAPITPATMAAQIERNRPDIVFLDFLTLIEGASDWQAAGQVSGQLKNLSQRYRIPIITAAQFNRKGEEKGDPGLTEIGISDKIGQDADLVISIRKFCKSVVVMKIVKFRHGPSGQMFYLMFDPNKGVMEEITFEKAQDIKDEEGTDEEEAATRKFVPRKKGSFHQAAQQRTSSDSRSDKIGNQVVRKVVRQPEQSVQRPLRLRRPQ